MVSVPFRGLCSEIEIVGFVSIEPKNKFPSLEALGFTEVKLYLYPLSRKTSFRPLSGFVF